jgi:hypothetical protein
LPATPGQHLSWARLKAGTSIAADQGPLRFGPADKGYDFINKRWRIPGYITCSVPPVIQLSGTTYQVQTAPTFSASGTGSDTYQWCLDGEPISGQTASTLAQSAVGPGDVTVRITRPDTAKGDCIVESNILVET